MRGKNTYVFFRKHVREYVNSEKHVRVFLMCVYWVIFRIFFFFFYKKGNSCPRSNVKICW